MVVVDREDFGTVAVVALDMAAVVQDMVVVRDTASVVALNTAVVLDKMVAVGQDKVVAVVLGKVACMGYMH